LVIDLFSLQLNSIKINNYNIFLDFYYPSDYTLLIVDIFIDKVIQDKYYTIIKNSQEGENFIFNLIKAIKDINIITILDKDFLKLIIQEYVRILETIWYKHPQCINIPKIGGIMNIRLNLETTGLQN